MGKNDKNQQQLTKRYQREKMLGEGGMGVVYQGIDLQTNKPVAIKQLRPEKVAGHPTLVERFSREAEALRALDHPNIVKVLATFTDENKQFIVMEFMDGGSLHDLLGQKDQLSIPRVLSIALDLADALTRAHRLGIIHRDLKPANVLLAGDGTVRLSDFGIAKVADSFVGVDHGLTKEGTILGTIDYLSPEACRGEVLDARTDIWALGVVLFEMLVGKRPFPHPATSPTVVSTLSAILIQPVPDLGTARPDAPESLIDLINRMLTKEREARIPSMRLVGAELEIILQKLTTAQHKNTAIYKNQLRFATPTPQPAGLLHHNLPKQISPFIGRESELAHLTKLLADADNRLVTLLGPGGTGKTRLVLEFARTQMPDFKNGVTFVPLAPLNSAKTILPAVVEAVGIQFVENMEPLAQLINYFQDKQTLLVLDNFEHLLDGAHLVGAILRAAPNIKVLATSREKLNLREEILFRIEGMDFPDGVKQTSLENAAQCSAIRLFAQAAKRARPGFELETKDMGDIIRICQLVRGLPLGILLAAAWVEMFSPQEILQEVRRNLDFLESEMSDIPERHRSIRAVFDSSWHQLTESQRQVFMKLSLFRGGFRRESAQTIAGANLPTLIKLVSKSLLYRDPATGRYEIHELLRQYAAEKLDASGGLESIRHAYVAYFAKFMAGRLMDMFGPRQTIALNEIESEFENVRQAWRYAVEHKDYKVIDQAAESLFVFCDMRSREYEGVALFEFAREQLASSPGEELHPTWGRLLLPWYDLMLQSNGRFQNDQQIKSQTENILDAAQKQNDSLGRAYGLIMLGHFTKPDEAIKLYEQALEIVPRLDDSFWVRIRIGFCYQKLGKHHQAIKAFRQSYTRGLANNESERMGWTLHNIGETEILLGNYDSALTHFQEAIPHFRQVGTLLGIISTKIKISFIMLWNGNFAEAQALLEAVQTMANDTNRANRIENEVLVVRSYLALMKHPDKGTKQRFEEHLSAFTNLPGASVGLVSLAEQLQSQTELSKPPQLGEQPLLEPLSERELEVLRLLKTELSGPEIARELMVSLNTVRFHTKNIYAKLHANNRRSAVNRAIELGL